MQELNIGPAADFTDPGRRIVECDGIEVGVFKLDGAFYAYGNICPHMGGPACQGRIIAKVDEDIAPDRTSRGFVFSKTQLNVICPWHGYEFDIRTGRHSGNSKMRLLPVRVRVSEQGDVIVALPPEIRRGIADAGMGVPPRPSPPAA
ncbi:MAG: Rieske 2Fe-2S domain-containing protein [Proteobacteria bacterium]|nr:Rieske 2Fe-2S domain-containing protein [Pseudomonadota bacterium]